ncbi:MAG TPA: lipid-A-disaccharide synthase N-terminal domain-containing protein [Acidobacteriota bacterium]|nr:lipid-A-disaccharide synthase N-terminal domain-containing protein [Acidobacteriota bacterium]
MKSISWWVLFGLFGQVVFALRFVIQWIASEKKKESYIPLYFWYLSLMGSIILLAYAIHRNDPVFILGQSTGFIVYIRNLMLIHQKKVEPVQTGSPPIDALNQKIRV